MWHDKTRSGGQESCGNTSRLLCQPCAALYNLAIQRLSPCQLRFHMMPDAMFQNLCSSTQHRSGHHTRRLTPGGRHAETTREVGVTPTLRSNSLASSYTTRAPMLCPNRANGLSSKSIEVIACIGFSVEATGARCCT